MMMTWTRAALVGSIFTCLHKKRAALAEAKRDMGQQSAADPSYELKLVQVIFRHGARTPLKPIPHSQQVEWSPTLLETPKHTLFNYRVTDLEGGPKPPSPFEERYRSYKLKGGTFPGQLTAIGMQQLFSLGARLRKDYVEERSFLSPTFKPSEVYARSTNVVRNLESMRCLLAGLFQQQQEGPVTIVTADAENEILYPNHHGCEGLRRLSSNSSNLIGSLTPPPRHTFNCPALPAAPETGSPLQGIRRMSLAFSLPGMEEELTELHQDLNIDSAKRVDFFVLMDNLLAEQAHGFPFSVQYESHLQRTERKVIDIVSYMANPNDRDTLKLMVGPFLYALQSNLLEATRRSSDDTQSRKLFLFASHDITLVPLLMAFGIFDQKWPPYASDITLELYQHQPSREWFTRLSYKGKEQVVKGCRSGLCPLHQFLNALSDLVISPEDYKTMCCLTEAETTEKTQADHTP